MSVGNVIFYSIGYYYQIHFNCPLLLAPKAKFIAVSGIRVLMCSWSMSSMNYAAAGAATPALSELHLLPNFVDDSLNSVRFASNISDGNAEHGHKPYKWRMVITYDGTRFSGWQYQQSIPTIQCLVEEALTRITKLERDKLNLVGAGRTDAGVHAWGQVAHFLTPFNYESLENIHRALNGFLPPDIRVREISPAVPEFHARFSVTSKIYHYKIYNETIMDPFQRHYAYHSTYRLNADVMRDAAKHFVGKHDFSAFANSSRNDRIRNPVKTIFRCDVVETGPLLQIEVEGTGFLYRQVRNMVALLFQVGRGAVPVDIVPGILKSKDRKELAKFAVSIPPHGLCLFTIKYNEQHLDIPEGGPAVSLGRHRSLGRCKLPCF